MKPHSIRSARENFAQLVEAAQRGETVVITKRGVEVACVVPIRIEGSRLPDLTDFRAAIQVQDTPLSSTVIDERESARF